MRHFILNNSWRICVSFRCFGIYIIKRIGDSELKSTTKCQFWLTYIFTLVIGTVLNHVYHFIILTPRIDSYTHECGSNASLLTETNFANIDITQRYKQTLIYIVFSYALLSIISMGFLLRRFAKELPTMQKDFNCIDLARPNYTTASIKNLSFGQYGSNTNKNVILLLTPFILQMIFIFGGYVVHLEGTSSFQKS